MIRFEDLKIGQTKKIYLVGERKIYKTTMTRKTEFMFTIPKHFEGFKKRMIASQRSGYVNRNGKLTPFFSYAGEDYREEWATTKKEALKQFNEKARKEIMWYKTMEKIWKDRINNPIFEEENNGKRI